MATDGLTGAVRERIGPGRLLPLGDAADTAWIAERAAVRVLRAALAGLPGAALADLRIDPAEWPARDGASPPVPPVPPVPPGGLPPGPLRIEAAFAATRSRPLPRTAAMVREALATSALRDVGLVVAAIDLRIDDLLEDEEEGVGAPEADATRDADTPVAPREGEEREERDPLRAAVLAVPGVAAVASAARHSVGGTRLEVVVREGYRALDVARAVRDAAVALGGTAAAVVVTDVRA
ncbi:hypothetical protein K7472_21950 [Streptomyces sp. PTM05]|uniref:Nucleopolyhedrovirus P10 family protein n=1 Tax=Streptantibioticus parmotrematis TaxID=2873249 RepID=A0ABS7QW92_9ACTN|nr:hypothetical protein [Streptantibioticus parmotrematis]MBY8887482.1 hypothetical protein [Streptantibioticus parmotrematis]